MPTNINIDETPLRPNVRPAPPPNRRGPLTFFVDIEEPLGRSVTRNLTRGVDDTNDDYTPTPQPPVDISLETLLLSLSLSSTFYLDIPVAFDPITTDLSLEQFEVGVGGNIDVPDLELSVDIEINAEKVISVSPIIVDLTLPSAELLTDIYGDILAVDLSLAEVFDSRININLPDNMESAQDDDTPVIG